MNRKVVEQLPPSKKVKRCDVIKHYYPSIPPTSEDETSTLRNISKLNEEIGKPGKSNLHLLKQLMARMLQARMEWIHTSPTLSEILEKYPLLKKQAFVSIFIYKEYKHY